jgi:hypothetical protein
MNTLRGCAGIGLAIAWVFASGCKSDSNTGKQDGGRRDGGSTRGDSRGSTTGDAGLPCTTSDGRTLQPGESYTLNCVHFTCLGGTNFSSSGSPCTDALPGTDARGGQDAPGIPDASPAADSPPADVAPPLDTGAGKDAPPSEAGGKKDTPPPLDTTTPEAAGPEVAAPEDTAPPAPDVATPEDLPPPVQCNYSGKKYNPGDTFACDCNTCICNSAGAILPLTSNPCDVDAE